MVLPVNLGYYLAGLGRHQTKKKIDRPGEGKQITGIDSQPLQRITEHRALPSARKGAPYNRTANFSTTGVYPASVTEASTKELVQ